eukprot:TRINITY_DN74612_c0_g1_i1.p1 TRINITY_DN74612_c0_g1~~TRINITY_DN74612_c0_g1_i1.p1  ORF type:complete len:651 (-),score=110.99 TRINITY_DN74612_c0_g1_i1:56-2008(-)
MAGTSIDAAAAHVAAAIALATGMPMPPANMAPLRSRPIPAGSSCVPHLLSGHGHITPPGMTPVASPRGSLRSVQLPIRPQFLAAGPPPAADLRREVSPAARGRSISPAPLVRCATPTMVARSVLVDASTGASVHLEASSVQASPRLVGRPLAPVPITTAPTGTHPTPMEPGYSHVGPSMPQMGMGSQLAEDLHSSTVTEAPPRIDSRIDSINCAAPAPVAAALERIDALQRALEREQQVREDATAELRLQLREQEERFRNMLRSVVETESQRTMQALRAEMEEQGSVLKTLADKHAMQAECFQRLATDAEAVALHTVGLKLAALEDARQDMATAQEALCQSFCDDMADLKDTVEQLRKDAPWQSDYESLHREVQELGEELRRTRLRETSSSALLGDEAAHIRPPLNKQCMELLSALQATKGELDGKDGGLEADILESLNTVPSAGSLLRSFLRNDFSGQNLVAASSQDSVRTLPAQDQSTIGSCSVSCACESRSACDSRSMLGSIRLAPMSRAESDDAAVWSNYRTRHAGSRSADKAVSSTAPGDCHRPRLCEDWREAIASRQRTPASALDETTPLDFVAGGPCTPQRLSRLGHSHSPVLSPRHLEPPLGAELISGSSKDSPRTPSWGLAGVPEPTSIETQALGRSFLPP